MLVRRGLLPLLCADSFGRLVALFAAGVLVLAASGGAQAQAAAARTGGAPDAGGRSKHQATPRRDGGIKLSQLQGSLDLMFGVDGGAGRGSQILDQGAYIQP
jgi:hypothetical protein